MIKIGLTGNIASGKTFIENIFKNLGIKTICADSIVHELLENDCNLKNKLTNIFSEEILTNDKIDRLKLGKIVFSDIRKKEQLEKIIHPIVLKKISDFFEKEKNEKMVVADIPLLFESNYELLFDKIVLVYADDNIRFERIKKRNNLDDGYIKKIMKTQINQDLKKEKSHFVIVNENKNLKELEKEVKKIIEEIK